MRYLTIAACVVLAGCGSARLDSGVSWAPSFIKQSQPDPSSVPPDTKPDLDVLLRKQAATAFSNIQSMQASEPTPNGRHWQFCAKVVSAGVMGGTIADTYIVEIAGGSIRDRRKDKGNFCARAIYRPVTIGS